MRIADLDAKESPKETQEHIRELIMSGRGYFESAHRRKDGSIFDAEITVTFIPKEKIFVSFVKDISERKRIRQAIRENEERFRQLAENIQEVFWLGSLDWQAVYYISPAYETIWGKSRQDLYENPLAWLDSVHEKDRAKVRQAIPKVIDNSTQTIKFPQYRIVLPDGDIRWIDARAFPIMNGEGEVYRIAGIAEDITDRKMDELEREKLVRELQIALDQVKTLTGFLPVCASCRKIRNEEGHWEYLESYIQRHSDAEITHSICPICALKLYPDYFDAEGLKKE
jgi:PAS domain S-box-containing protein